MKDERIDKLLVELGHAPSRAKAQAMVMAGVVLADERRIDKPSQPIAIDANIRIKGDSAENRYVGRGGLKLEHAIREFHICLTAYICLDIGSSTGGFTDCLLKHGASRVVAIDSGTNQMVWELRSDERVDLHEKTNARRLRPEEFDVKFDLATIDVSFISVKKILPVIPPLITEKGRIIVLIKPQFEVGKGEVGKGGIVRNSEQHQRVIEDVNTSAKAIGFKALGITDSPILGAEGNKEFLALYGK